MNRLIYILLITSLIFGTNVVIFSTHWFPIWLGLELSTLSVLPLLSTNMISRSNEATLKYFLIQAFSAALLLNGAALNIWFSNSWDISFSSNISSNFIITLALIIKLGLAPCHFWFPDVLSGISFLNGLIIASWQKIAPLFLIILSNSPVINELLLLSSSLSVIIGGWGGLNQISIRKILAYSSISHIGWIVGTSFFSQNASMILFFLYLIINSLIFLLCHLMNTKFISSLNNINVSPIIICLFLVSILSIGGLPPLGGFINKIIPIIVFNINNNFLLLIPFLIGSLLSLFFYLRIVFNTGLILFPQHSMTLINWRGNPNPETFLLISVFFPFTLLSLITLPIFYTFI